MAHPAEIRSFDVFDTVLTRRVGRPTALLHLMGERLFSGRSIPCSANAFVEARTRYEHKLTVWFGRPAKLAEIYVSVAGALCLGPEDAEHLSLTELELERELSIAVPGARKMVDEARKESANSNVLFVSDTPHPEDFLRELLSAQGLFVAGDRVYGSAARGASKSAGGLFTIVAKEIGLPPASFLHTGDNVRNDVAAARVEGWRGRLQADGRLSRYEELMERNAPSLGTTISAMAGASRLARLEARTDGLAAEVADVASGVVAPFLIGYMCWIAAQAQLRGVRRLYFVARDAEVMLRIARPVLNRIAPDLECRYFYGSRQAWMLAASAYSDEILERWVTVRSDFTMRTTLARVGLSPEQVWEHVKIPLTNPVSADEPLSLDNRRIVSELLRTEPLYQFVREAAAQAAEVMTAYLRQEGFFDDSPSALVDTGWTGGVANAFDEVLSHAGGPAVHHFVVGVLQGQNDHKVGLGGRTIRAWLFDERHQQEVLRGFSAPNVMIEMFCGGTEGRLVGYERQGDVINPVLTAPDNVPLLEWGLTAVHDIAVQVAELFVAQLPAENVPRADWTGLIWSLLEAFWMHPTASEARRWGEFPWEEEIWPPFNPVAQSLSTCDVLARLRRGDSQIRRNNSWRAGSALASAQPWRSLLQIRGWERINQVRLQRLPRRLQLEIQKRRPGQ